MEPSILNLLAGVPVYIVVFYWAHVTRRDQLEARKADLALFGEITGVIQGMAKDLHAHSKTIERHGAIVLAAVLRIIPPHEGQLLKQTIRAVYPDSELAGPAGT